MWIRSLMILFAVGCTGIDTSVDTGVDTGIDTSEEDQAASPQEELATDARREVKNFECFRSVVAICAGKIDVIPITISLKNVRLNDKELRILSREINRLAILDGQVLDRRKMVNDVKLKVFKVVHQFEVNAKGSDINVCGLGDAGETTVICKNK